MVTLVNRAKMTTSTTGTGTITLGSAVSGFQTFADAGVSNGQTVRYTIEDGTNFEIGSGTYTASGTTLSRNVSESSNSDAAINLSGSAEVFVTAAAADILSAVVDDTTPQLGGDLDVGTHRIETTESNMNFEVDSDASSTGYEGYYFYGGPTTNGYNRIWITGTETALQQRVGTSTAYSAFIQNNNQYSIIINEHGGDHPAKITNWGNGSSAHLNIGVRHADAKVRFTDHTGNTLRYAFPNSTPSSGQVLTASDGSGTLSWAAASGGADLYAAETTGSTDPTASGTLSIAIGSGTTVSGNQAVAVGRASTVAGFRAAAFGGDNIASQEKSLALGFGSTSQGTRSAALYGTVTAQDSLSFGTNSYVQGSYAAAFGYNADITSAGSNGTALGYNAQVAGSGATAINNSYASGSNSLAAAIANNTSSYGATGANSIAIGYQAKATNTYSTSIGSLNNVTAYGAFGAGDANTVSGDYGVAIGRQNTSGSTVSGRTNVALGYGNTATGGAAFAIGDRASTQGIYGKMAHSSGYGAGLGTAQSGEIVLYGATTDATPKTICSGAGSSNTADATNQVVLPNNSVYGFTGMVIARENSAQTNDFAVWEIKGGAVRAGSASTTALGSFNINKISESTGAANWSIALSADTTNGAVAITVTGEASHSIRWVATVNTTEVTY